MSQPGQPASCPLPPTSRAYVRYSGKQGDRFLHSLREFMKHITLGTPPICPQPGDGPADERRHLDSALSSHSDLTQLGSILSSFLFSPPSTQPNPPNQRSGPCYGNTRHRPIAISLFHHHTHRQTDQTPSHISPHLNSPTPVLTKITAYYQILPMSILTSPVSPV